MAYKGQDLDLRLMRGRPLRGPATPIDAAGSSTWPAGGWGTHREAPIAVDETVLACCNHAFDAALFYGSREVRLEHLIYALTRVAAAAEVLDEAGLRPERMRREAALVLAADTPNLAADAKSAPVASGELEAVLRQAAERSGWQATLPDVLKVILLGGSQSPAATLLMRSAADPQRLDRWRDETRRDPVPAELLRAVAATDRSEDILARLEGLESAARTLAAEAVADRRMTQDLLRQVHDKLQSLSDYDTRQVLADRSGEVKATLGGKLDELSDLILALDERVANAGKAGSSGDLWDELRERIKGIEQRVTGSSAEIARNLSAPLEESLARLITDRLRETDAGAARLLDDGRQSWIDAGERLTALDSSIRAHLQGAEDVSKTHERDLGEIYEALVKLGANQQTLANNLNTWRLDTSGDVSIVSNRLEALETTVLETLGRISAEVHMLRDPAYTEDAPSKANGFKRWLYGTSSVLTTWRDEHSPIRRMLERASPDKKS
jgi:hypothetical protein